MNNFKQISELLAKLVTDVSKELLPNGKRQGNEWCAGSTNGEAGNSLKICLSGNKAGVWSDFATSQSGDLLDLWSATKGISLYQALNEAKIYLGIDKPRFESLPKKRFQKPKDHDLQPVKNGSPAFEYLTKERKLSPETLSAFQVGEKNNEIAFSYYRDDELLLVKYLGLNRIFTPGHPDGKKMIRSEPGCEPCLFGWDTIPKNSRRIVITEGEIDAMTLYQYGIPALSVPFGAGSGQKQAWIEHEYDRLAVYDEVYLCFDPDAAGDAAVAEIIERLGRHRCRVIKLPFKDPNECLQHEISKDEINRCINSALTLDPQELKNARDYEAEVIEEFYPNPLTPQGYNPPWQYTKGKILFRPSELSIWCGINGHGKSQVLGQAMLSCMQQGARVCIASLEIKPKKLLARLTRQAAGLDQPTEQYIKAIQAWYSDKLWIFDLVGTAKVDRLLEVFLYAKQRYGVDVFVIDSFMKCGIDEEDFKAQKIFVDKLCDFKNEYNCHIHIIAHPRKPSDEGQAPSKLDVKGTGAITDLADNCFSIWRNKAKEELLQIQINGGRLNSDQERKLEQSDAIWRCDKQRNGEWEGKTALWFDKKSFQFLGNPRQRPAPYVEFSNNQSHQGAHHAPNET